MATTSPVLRRRFVAGRHVWWLHRWHLLSLDAPSVATLWTWFVARSVSLQLPPALLISMFLAVWTLYAADRILDSRPLFSNPLCTEELEARHLFHHQHVTAFLSAILGASVALAMLLPGLDAGVLRLDVLLGALLFGWFLLIHARALPPSSTRRRLPKEIAVGIFFPVAIFIPTAARIPSIRLPLLSQAVLFAAVCTLNCLSIYAWEHAEPHTAAHWTTRLGVRHLRAVALIIGIAGSALTVDCAVAHTALWRLSLASTMSAFGLLILDLNSNRVNLDSNRVNLHGDRIAPLTLRAAADLVLLTPTLVAVFLS